jgi:hypothetical protein
MTAFDMYARDTRRMMNIELARVIQAEREREIQAELRRRRLLTGDDGTVESRRDVAAPARRLQRPASGMASR